MTDKKKKEIPDAMMGEKPRSSWLDEDKYVMDESTEEQVFAHSKGIFEQLKGVPIEIDLKGTEQHQITSSDDNTGYRIIVNKTGKEGDAYTGMETCLSRVLFDSPVEDIREFGKDLAAQVPDSYKPWAEESIQAVAEILEKRRCESGYGSIYHGSRTNFWVERKRKGDQINLQPTDPLSAIVTADFERDDLVKKTEFSGVENYLKDVEKTDENGSVLLAQKYWEEVMLPWIEKQVKLMKMPPPCKGKPEDGKTDASGKPVESEFVPDSKEGKDAKKKLDKEKELAQALIERNETKYMKQSGNCATKCNKSGKKSLAEAIARSKERGGEYIQQIQEKLDKVNNKVGAKLKPLGDKIKLVDRPMDSVDIDLPLCNQLSKIFKQIEGRSKEHLDEEGNDMDTEAIIQRVIRKDTADIFLEDERITGLSIVIGVDCSGSMGGSPIDQARNLCGTLYKAIAKLKGVDIKVIAWGAPSGKHEAWCTVIDSLKDVGKLTVHHNAGGTPTHLAHQFCVEELRKMKGDRKVLIQITDGMPGCYTGNDYQDEHLPDLVRQTTYHALQIGQYVMGVFIGNDQYAEQQMRIMFCDRYVGCNTMTEARTVLVNQVKKHIISHIKNQ
jgi:hypothetical protein